MFTSFEAELDTEAPRRLAIAGLVAMALLGALAFGAMVFTGKKAAVPAAERLVDVSFRPLPPPPPPVKIEHAPPPLPPKVAKVVAPAPSTAVEVPAPAAAAAPLVAPKELPTKSAPEVSPDQAVAAREVAVGGIGDGSGTAVGGSGASDESPAPVAAVAGGGPINLPEDADPPEPADENVMPEYPEAERTVGHESVVILKIVIEADGRVGRIQVMKGDEPFLAAALNAVRNWRYEPAKLDGQTIATFKIVKIPFRLKS